MTAMATIAPTAGICNPQVMEGIDGRHLDRALARLGNSDDGLEWLTSIGIGIPFARRAGIGVGRETGDGLPIVHVARRRDGVRHLSGFSIDHKGEVRPPSSGAPSCHWSDAPGRGAHVLVLRDLFALWRLEQALGATGFAPYVAFAPLHPRGLPMEWSDPGFWAGFGKVTLFLDDLVAAGSFMAVVGSAAGTATSIATPPDGPSWMDWLEGGRVLDGAALEAIVEDAPPLARVLGAAEEATRRGVESIDIHDCDGSGRLMRLVRLEERAPAVVVAGRRLERVRLRDVVVRSDGMLLDVVRLPSPPSTPACDRVAALSDGTRLERWPPAATQARWSLDGVRCFLARESEVDVAAEADMLLAAVMDELAAATGLDEAAARVAAAFVLLGYVHQGIDELRVPVFAGGAPRDRARLVRSLARLCHGGVAVGRSRARALARMADEGGGTLLLDEPGPLAGPTGTTETGRFLLASCLAELSVEHVAEAGSGLRGLRTFGPRAVFAQRFGTVSLSDVELRVPISFVRSTCGRADPRRIQALVDRLYAWGMAAVGRLERSAGTRDGAVSAILALTGSDGEDVCAGGSDESAVGLDCAVADPGGLMAEALEACMAGSGGEVAITELMLEAAMRGGLGEEFSPERVGRWLVASGRLDPDQPSTRRRLHGHIARIYMIAASDNVELTQTRDPFAFCTANRCVDCRYARVCDSVIPGLKNRKATRI